MSKFSFPQEARILKRKQFLSIQKKGVRSVGQNCIFTYSCHPSKKRPRLGLRVSAKFGKAHERNRFKRITREAFRLIQHLIPKGYDLVISPRSKAKEATTHALLKEIQAFVKNLSTCEIKPI